MAGSEDVDDTVPATGEEQLDPHPGAPVVLTKPRGDRYRLGTELGRGGMGRVVEAFDVQLGRTVALKEVLPTITGMPRRFAREVQITARLEHPAIVPLYDAGLNADGRPYYVMRRVSGRPLDELIARAQNLDERLVLLPAVLAAIDAIAHAHTRGVIHRDLKPANILVGDLGETVVIDWGLAKVIGEPDEIEGSAELAAGDSLQTQFGSVFGTPGFMSPEQARGEELGTEGDVYALGAVLYQLLAGKPPHAGTSATELLESTHKRVKPLHLVAPNAPTELAAIVDKALALDAAKRYGNATQLGEDVRRFTLGQLVAAHRYTRRERIARFARRHRGVLAVAALASVTLAGVAWIGVHRIVVERDRADAARHDAIASQHVAEEARDREATRAEAQVALRARSLIEDNPTEAVGLIKQIATSKPLAAEVRAIAKSAVARGVAWALAASDELTLSVELDETGTRLLQTVRSGTLSVFDLDKRRLVIARQLEPDGRATWVGDQILVHGHAAPQLLDPATGQTRAIAGPSIDDVVASGAGAFAVGLAADHRAMLVDVHARTTRELARSVTAVAISPDGAWIALADRTRAWIIDRTTGTELAHHDGANRMIAIGDGRLAVLGDTGLVEYRGGAWLAVPLPPKAKPIMYLAYAGENLAIADIGIDLQLWNGKVLWKVAHADSMSGGPVVVGDGLVMLPDARGRIAYASAAVGGELRLPSQVEHLRLAGHPGRTRLVAVGTGIIIGYDLAAIVPRAFPITPLSHVLFVDEGHLLVWGTQEWAWRDLALESEVRFELLPHGPGGVSDFDPKTGRVTVDESGPSGRLMLLHENQTRVDVIVEGHETSSRIVPGGPIVYGGRDGRIMASDDGAPGKELVKLDGAIAGIAVDDRGAFSAISAHGEIVRGSLASDRITRSRVTPTGNMFVAIASGRTLVVLDDRLMVWDDATPPTEVVKFETQIASVHFAAPRIIVSLVDRGVYWLDLGGKQVQRLLAPLASAITGNYDGRLLAGLDHDRRVTLVDTRELARWSLPMVAGQDAVEHVSPGMHRLITTGMSDALIWHLPQLDANLAAELDRLTNATEDVGGVFAWPWQHAEKL